MAGHKGLVGSAICRKLNEKGFKKIIVANRHECNLEKSHEIKKFFAKKKIDGVIIAAAKVGGILANQTYPYEYLLKNLKIQNNLIDFFVQKRVKSLVFLGSSCIYPKFSKIPIKESYLLNGKLERTNEAYALAKIAGVKMCEYANQQFKLSFKCLMPCNIYGLNDNFDSNFSHFIPALIKKVHISIKENKKNIVIWGSGKPKRELLFSDDLADACIFFLKKKTKENLINIGSGVDYSIVYYLKKIMKIYDCNLKIIFDKKKPDGTLRKLLDISLAKSYGWKPKISLDDGLNTVISEFKNKY